MTRGSMKNIRDDWREIGGNKREKERRDQKGPTKKEE